jgi:hypothetical protein
MDSSQWRTLAIFGAAIVGLGFINPKAAVLAAGTVFLVVLLKSPLIAGLQPQHQTHE